MDRKKIIIALCASRAVAAYGAVGHAGFGGHAAVDGKRNSC